MTRERETRERAGVLLALGAFLIWGLLPIFFKALEHVPPFEMLAHRIVWTAALTLSISLLWGGWRGLRHAVRQPRVLGTLACSACLLSVNWLTFIYAVISEQLLAASLGYFINPLVSILLGVAILRERLGVYHWAAAALAGVGVINLTLYVGELPWISLTLAVSFGLYGLLRKQLPVPPRQGLAIETALLSPMALAYLLCLGQAGTGLFTPSAPGLMLLLASSGIFTAAPLLLFVAGAQRIKLSAVGLLQYVAPSLQFLLAVGLYGEPFTRGRLVTFLFIWAGLAVYSLGASRAYRPSGSSSAPPK